MEYHAIYIGWCIIYEKNIKKKILVFTTIVLLVFVSFVFSQFNKPLEEIFPKHVCVFGVNIYATESLSDEKFNHITNILYEYLDNDQNGIPDNQLVVDEMVKNNASMVVADTQNELIKISLLHLGTMLSDNIQDLYGNEIHINGSEYGEFDASYEEILHLITHVGYANVYPEVWGEVAGTQVANLMDIARGGYFDEVPKQYPDTAWYTYYDETADYSTMVTEYIYWSLTSLLGIQDFEGRYEMINEEWKLNTTQKMLETEVELVELLQDPIYAFPTVKPTGTYSVQ